MYDIIIVGAGPAGMTAAIYAKRASKKVLVLEARSYGGQILNTNNIENYPCEEKISGFDFSDKLYNQIVNLGAEIKFEKVVKIEDGLEKNVITNISSYKTKTIIIATGSDNRKLGLDNEDKLIGKGVSYCATCDGAFFKGKTVAVVGGGNSALEEAIYLSDIASKVYLIHRRNQFRADEKTIDLLNEKNNLEFVFNSNITKLNGSDKLESIEVTNRDDAVRNIEIDGLFIAVGRIPENQNFSQIINLDDYGYIIADENCHTNRNGIFVAGDCRTKSLRQLVTATSDGAVAATEAIKYINNL